MKWYSTLGVHVRETGEMVLDARVPPESPWFDGHFPDDPTLPGIAQLEMAAHVVSAGVKQGVPVAGFRKVRFKRIIRPNEELRIIAKKRESDNGAYAFRILAGDELACNGVLFLKDPDNAKEKRE